MKNENFVVQLPQSENLEHNPSSIQKPAPLSPEPASPMPTAGLLWEEGHTSPQNRLRSCHHAPHAQPGTSSITGLLRPVWCGIKVRVQSGGPEFKSLALLLIYLVCGQITAPLWLCFSTCKMDTIRLWGSNEKMYIKGSTHSKSATGSYYLTQAEVNCHWVKLKFDSLKTK